MGHSLSAPVGRKAQSIQSQQAGGTESSARTPHSSETQLEMIIQPKKISPSHPLAEICQAIREGSFPKKSQSALSSRDPGPGTVLLLHLNSPTNGPEGTSCGQFSFGYHGAEAGEELGLLPELGRICWSCGFPTKGTCSMLQSG